MRYRVDVPPRFPSTADLQARTLKRGENVRLVAELPGVAVGTEGKVAMANGFAWNRYWVRLRDGRVIGHVDHSHLVRSKYYERYAAARAREAEEALRAPAEQAGADTTEPTSTDGAAPGGDAVVNGVTVPAYLLQRSADARARLSA